MFSSSPSRDMGGGYETDPPDIFPMICLIKNNTSASCEGRRQDISLTIAGKPTVWQTRGSYCAWTARGWLCPLTARLAASTRLSTTSTMEPGTTSPSRGMPPPASSPSLSTPSEILSTTTTRRSILTCSESLLQTAFCTQFLFYLLQFIACVFS